jgi:hypothetical protein
MRLTLISSGVLALVAAVAVAADFPEFPKPNKEHEWLQQFVGEWELDSEASMGPGQPPMKCQGRESVKSMGGFWIVSNMESQPAGMPMTAVLTLGYDPSSKKYVGTWVDSMTSHLWKYEGSLDATGKILTLNSEGPNCMAGGKLAKFREITEFTSPDERVYSSQVLGDNGEWITFMSGTAKRKSAPKP